MRLAVVVSAHANWRALDWVLLAYRHQTVPPERVVVAEDSEFPEVAEVVARHAAAAPYPITHLHQPNQGFRKWRLLNRAIAEASEDYLVFTDADVLPRRDVVQTFHRLARPGEFLATGSHINLPATFHEERLKAAQIASGELFERTLLAGVGVRASPGRLIGPGRVARLLDRLTQRDAFVGNLSGAWRDDLLAVHGFDESFRYGGGDRNLGVRLNNAGVRGRRARHSLVCLHLDHGRSYRHQDEVERNKAYNRSLVGSGVTRPRASLLLPGAAGGDR